jgi:hypothetical protein
MDTTFQHRAKQAEATSVGDKWKHRKTGKVVTVTHRVGRFGVGLLHESGKRTMKLDHYLASDYELEYSQFTQPKEKT